MDRVYSTSGHKNSTCDLTSPCLLFVLEMLPIFLTVAKTTFICNLSCRLILVVRVGFY